MNSTSEPWFKPKTHGYGAYPANWKGWAAIGAYAVVMTVLAMIFIVEPSKRGVGIPQRELFTYLGLAAAVSVAFLALCRFKTDGGWSWRWGDDGGGKR